MSSDLSGTLQNKAERVIGSFSALPGQAADLAAITAIFWLGDALGGMLRNLTSSERVQPVTAFMTSQERAVDALGRAVAFQAASNYLYGPASMK